MHSIGNSNREPKRGSGNCLLLLKIYNLLRKGKRVSYRDQQTSSAAGQDVNIPSLVGKTVNVTATQLCCRSTKIAADNARDESVDVFQ